jgi:DNA adenine methylase
MQILWAPEQYDDISRAWAYYVNVQMSFANKLNAGWGRAVLNENNAETWSSKLSALPEKLSRLKQSYIEKLDELECLDKWDSPQTFFYCDPPYIGTDQGHYEGYTADQWQALCAKLDSIQGSYILSGYAQAIEPQSAQQRVEITAYCSASAADKVDADRSRKATAAELGDRQRTEILWICDRSANVRDELKPVLRRQQGPQQVDLFGDAA